MANQWLRLWHDMPNDPKWRTIARLSGQPISLVQAAYVHLLVEASRNVTRGHASVTAEDLASALDVTEDAIKAIFEAMQKRVLEGMYLMGWEKRQPKREDLADGSTAAKTPAQRKADQRAREKQAAEEARDNTDVTQCHDESRNVTTDKEERRKEDRTLSPGGAEADGGKRKGSHGTDADYECARWLFGAVLKVNPTAKKPSNWTTWANHVRLIREQDGRSHREICELFQWAKQDKFWSANIQSPDALRRQWDVLTERRAAAKPTEAPPKVKDWE